jgi:hypothetical protein
MARRVYLSTRDLLFRSKLEAVVRDGRADVSRDEAACELAVVELGGPEAVERVVALVHSGVPVLAYGSHVRADLLTAARAAGATAVPNSQVVERLAGMLNN